MHLSETNNRTQKIGNHMQNGHHIEKGRNFKPQNKKQKKKENPEKRK